MAEKNNRTDTTELILLGQLMESPKTGYQMKKAVEVCVSHYADISISSIYYKLESMEKQELVVPKIKQQGTKPAQKIYSITKKGRDKFHELLLENLNSIQKVIDPFNVGISLMKHAEKRQILEALDKRLEDAKKSQDMIKKAYHIHKLHPYESLLFDRGMMFTEAQIRWLNHAIRKIRDN